MTLYIDALREFSPILLFVPDFLFLLCYSLFLFFPDVLKDFQRVSLTFKYYSMSLALIALALFPEVLGS